MYKHQANLYLTDDRVYDEQSEGPLLLVGQ